MGKRRYQKKRGPFYRINHFIHAQEVRVVDEKGKQIDVMPLSKALNLARERNLDLVEVAPKAKPPVCKIINFKKFKFLEAKKKREEKKKIKKVEIKQVRLTPFIATNDLKFRLQKAQEFLKDGDKVKLSVFFRGREMTKKEFGYELLKKGAETLSAYSKVDLEPRFVGRRLEMQLSPVRISSNKPKTEALKKNGKNKTKDKKVSQKKV